MPGAFKLEHLQSIEPIFFQEIFNFFPFILGRPIIITPEGQLSGKGVLPTSEMDETETETPFYRINGSAMQPFWLASLLVCFWINPPSSRAYVLIGSTPHKYSFGHGPLHALVHPLVMVMVCAPHLSKSRKGEDV